MALNVPPRYEPKIEQLAQSQHITADEALDQVIRAGLDQLAAASHKPRVSYASLFGAAKGPGTHKSREEVDRYIAELRAEW